MKTYVLKSDVTICREFPAPADEELHNWYVVDVPDGASLVGKRYDPELGRFIDDKEAEVEAVLSIRQELYKEEADPLYMNWQGDLAEVAEGTKTQEQADASRQAWLKKKAEIKERHPLPAE